jgi:D-lyxose ketol-isomerase
MKRSQINRAIGRAITSARALGVALPAWAPWSPDNFGASADGIRKQGLGWKVVDFGQGKFEQCGLVILAVCCPLLDDFGEPLTVAQDDYPVTGFSRKYLFVQSGQVEPHHFHRQKTRKEVTVVAGGTVRFELAWADGDRALSNRPVKVHVDGIWHDLPANGEIFVNPGETITLPGELSHIIEVMGDNDVVLLETSTANNDRKDNIFPFIDPAGVPIEEDEEPQYQLLDEHRAVVR